MIVLYKRLGLSEEEYAAKLKQKYESGMSHKNIANELECHFSVIEKACKKYKIVARNELERLKVRVKHVSITDLEKQVLDGIMLADGHLLKSSIAARLSYGCKYLQTLDDISKQLFSFGFNKYWQSSKTGCWHFKSESYSELLNERIRWYPNGIKIVPNDIKITPTSCYWWFVGDGFAVDYGVVLCTDAFDETSKNILISELQKQGFSSHIIPSNGRIRIEGRSAPLFLDWIKNNVNISPQYLYKWENGKRMKII